MSTQGNARKWRRFMPWLAATLVMVGVLALTGPFPGAGAAANLNPGVIPPQARAHGMSYGEWVGAWWKWAASIPAGQNPILDTTGEFGSIGQSGPVWFLAGSFGGTVSRQLVIPPGKTLFFPVFNSLWWAPDDLDDATWLAEDILGLDASQMTDEELISLIANYQVDFATLMEVTVDGVPVQGLSRYRAESQPQDLTDTDLLDTIGAEVSHPNAAIGAGYWLMLAPLPPGKHTVRIAVESQNPVFGDFSLDVSYELTVKPLGKAK